MVVVPRLAISVSNTHLDSLPSKLRIIPNPDGKEEKKGACTQAVDFDQSRNAAAGTGSLGSSDACCGVGVPGSAWLAGPPSIPRIGIRLTGICVWHLMFPLSASPHMPIACIPESAKYKLLLGRCARK